MWDNGLKDTDMGLEKFGGRVIGIQVNTFKGSNMGSEHRSHMKKSCRLSIEWETSNNDHQTS